ncbi:RagB/SusD family nutrient uptake outer membrane protein [Galbibacter mesophilus]|uniref:RagB/SusD family nutrient uptake outer membrane protein n=1 Tax=Galbibacter mesophilus TaxID=379069 RepID=UPI00191D035C|nr:RagB/SusD family nutrient uptake outer membrane protein [Galbibacter mesophilus]MCM5664034.1 RagB/SusD family nutrient uptake outer membrane protein [Galbibacter mesophilus]
MKKISIIIVALIIFGCSEDYLERSSLTDLSETSFWQNESDALLGINGIYDALQDRVLYSGNLNGATGLPQHGSFGDETFNRYKFEGAGRYVEGNVDPSTGYFQNLWRSLYSGIGRANAALEKIPEIPKENISEESRDILLGQAKFLRALFYYHLAVYFEEAPLVLKVQTLDEAYVKKNTFEDIANQVILDLEEAIEVLPPSYPDDQYGYATKAAAQGILARFHLYNGNYQEAADLTLEIMGAGYSLEEDYATLFTMEGENSNEIIFSVRFFQDPATGNGETFSATFQGIPKVNEQPMPNAVNDYYCIDGLPIDESPLFDPKNEKENRDPRLSASVFFEGDIFNFDLNRPFKGNTNTGYGKRKYIRTRASADGTINTNGPGSQDFIVLRYADILLMRAEALTELGQLGEVPSLINQVRQRVGMPTVEEVEGTGLTQDALMDIVRHERRIELMFEGLRFYDLKRWGEMEEAYQRIIADNVPAYNPNYRGQKSTTFPIPLSELDANTNLTQNPAWQ